MYRLLILVLLASCGKAERAHTQASRRGKDGGVEPAVPAGPPDYGSFEEVARAGAAAPGKTALLELRRLYVRPDQLVGEPCTGGDGNLIFIGFKPAERDLVRGLPFAEKTCGRVLVRVSLVDSPGFHSGEGADGGLVIRPNAGTLVEGYALEFVGTVAKPAPVPPSGADFGDVDEIGFAGEQAEGKRALINGRLWIDLDKIFFAPCDGHHGMMILDGPLDTVRAKRDETCHPVRFRIHYSSFKLAAKEYRFGGTMEE